MKWEQTTLGEVSLQIQTGPFGSQLHESDYSEFGIPVVMPKDIVNGRISEASIARVTADHVERLCRHKIQIGDILYSRRGDVGRCAYVTDNESGWLCGTGCLRVTVDTLKADSKFVFYQLQKPDSVGWVEKHAVGSTMLNLNTSILSQIPIKLPPIEEQHRIASILSAYDDLIENNQKQIKLLEEAAQRLYKEWFVDLRFPGYEKTRIVDGVPEGWRKASVTDLLEIKYGKDHKALADGNIPVYGSGGVMRKVSKPLHTGESVLIPRKGTLNNIFYVSGPFWTIDTMFYSVPRIDNVAQYVYLFLKGIDMESFNTGAAVPSMTVQILSGIITALPDSSTLRDFVFLIYPIFDKIKILYQQIDVSNQERDKMLDFVFQ